MAQDLEFNWSELITQWRAEWKEAVLRCSIKSKGYDPEDIEFLKKHLTCRIYLPDRFTEHYFMDDVHIVTIDMNWKT